MAGDGSQTGSGRSVRRCTPFAILLVNEPSVYKKIGDEEVVIDSTHQTVSETLASLTVLIE